MHRQHRLPRAISALDEMFEILKQSFEESGIDDKTAFCINLAAEELFTNMVRHNVGSSDVIAVETDITDGRILFRLTDFDVEPFDPDSVPEADVEAPIEDRTPGGLGLHLVRSIVDKVTYEYEASNREMTVTVIKLRST